ncbi:MAG: tyrosine-type recombinase/integrase [Magnetococcales bacterium]|nr:tyrosine-type recombinase/integrase [Magnetococcales bacterium]
MVDAAIIRSKVEGTVRDTRDVAMILVARDILARSSELVAMNREDVQFDEDGAGTVLIRKSKTDQEGMGAQRWISPDTVQALKKWLLIAGIDKGAMFQAVTKGGNVKRGTRLSTTDVYRSIQRLGSMVGLDLSGHSCRVGMAQDLTDNGAELGAIMQAGRWKSPTMPARYSERLAAGRGAVADLYKKKGVGFREDSEERKPLPPAQDRRP